MPPFEPHQFGKYKLVQPLAQGGMAEIFLARQQGPAGYEKTVVIKRVLSHFSSDADFVEMFLDEARIAAQLSHPNIVQIFDFGQIDGSYYLCMEYLRGEDLHAVVKLAKKQHAQVPVQVAATVVAAACDALHYAHTLAHDDGTMLHLVHRDISPSNLFVTYQGIPKVLDFGIARAEGKVVKTAAGVIKGKLAYMSPEQARGKALDARSDVWALGAVLYELLSGFRLFWRSNEAAMMRALLQDPIPPLREHAAGVPQELEEICQRALQRDLEQRYPTAQAMHAELDDYLGSRTYVPAPSLLQDYLKNLVGEQVISQKMKVATGALPAAPVPSSPGTAAPTESVRRKLVTDSRAEARTLATGPRPASEAESQPAPPPAPARSVSRVGLVAGPVLLFVVAALGFSLWHEPAEQGTERKAIAPVALPPEEPEPAPPPPESAPAPVAPPTPTPTPTPAGEPEKPAAPKPAAKGLLDVNCVPWCQIWIDGKDTGRTSPAMGISLSPGKHRLKVTNPPSGVEQEREVTVKPGTTSREVIRF